MFESPTDVRLELIEEALESRQAALQGALAADAQDVGSEGGLKREQGLLTSAAAKVERGQLYELSAPEAQAIEGALRYAVAHGNGHSIEAYTEVNRWFQENFGRGLDAPRPELSPLDESATPDQQRSAYEHGLDL